MFLSKIFVVAAAIATAPLIAPPSAAGMVAQSASGSGQFEFTSDAGLTGLRTFAFEASKSSDGSVIRKAEVKNRATEVTFHIRIDCLHLIGNVAVASGAVTAASGSGTAVGDAEIFGVQDNGEGANAPPDLITRGRSVCVSASRAAWASESPVGYRRPEARRGTTWP
jgi:hypothetical protein